MEQNTSAASRKVPTWGRLIALVLVVGVTLGGLALLIGALLVWFGFVPEVIGSDGKTLSSADLAGVVVAGATMLLAAGTGVLALFTWESVLTGQQEVVMTEKALRAAQDQLALGERQFEATRRQMRPHLELEGPGYPSGGGPANARVVFVGGSEPPNQVQVWVAAKEGHYGRDCNSPSALRPTWDVQIGTIPDHMEERWAEFFGTTERELALTEGEWWAAVTWRAPDGYRDGWMYVQRAHHVETLRLSLPQDAGGTLPG